MNRFAEENVESELCRAKMGKRGGQKVTVR